MTPTLPQLPLEIIEAIADELVTPTAPERNNSRPGGFPQNVLKVMDYMKRMHGISFPPIREITSLRLVCRELERKTFCVFARTCFGFLRTDLSARSIQRLREISEHDQIKDYVHTLHVTLFWQEEEPPGFGDGFSWNRSAEGQLAPPLPAFDAVREMLDARFVSCRTFYIHEDLAAEPLADEVFWDDIVSAFLSMIGDMKLPAKGFHTRKSQRDRGQVVFHPDHIRREDIQRPEFVQVWSEHLEELTLKWFDTDSEKDVVGGLVTAAKRLRKLDLRGEMREIPLLGGLVRAGLSPGLRDLRLRYFYADQDTLVKLLRQFHHSLQHVTLYRSRCTSGEWRGVFEELEGLQLHSFTLFALLQDDGGLFFDPLVDDATMQFVARKNSYAKDKRLWGVSYAGPNAQGAMRKVLDKYYVSESMGP